MDPAFCLPSQIADLALTDHNWLGKRDGDGLAVAKGHIGIDLTHVEGGDPIYSELAISNQMGHDVWPTYIVH